MTADIGLSLIDETALAAARAAVRGWIAWAIRTGSGPDNVLDHALGDAILAYADALKPDADGWYPMESYHEGSRVLFFLEEGEKGNGEIASGMAFKDDGGSYSSFWTWGGPNSGSVVDEAPAKWRPLPNFPERKQL